MTRYSSSCLSFSLKLLASLGAIAILTVLPACASKKSHVNEIQTLPTPCFSKLWATQLTVENGDRIKNVYVLNDVVHAVTTDNFDFAVKRAGGDLQFVDQVAPPDIELQGGPMQLADKFVFPTTNTMEVFNNRGRRIASVKMPFTVTGPGIAAGNMIYIGADLSHGAVAAVDVNQPYNVKRWHQMAYGPVHGAPAYYQDPSGPCLYYASDGGTVLACNSEDQVQLWPLLENPRGQFKTGNRIRADLRVDKFGLYVASTDGRLYVLNRLTGKLLWQYFAGIALKTAPEITSDTVYQLVDGVGLVALNKSEKVKVGDTDVERQVHGARWTCPEAIQFLADDDAHSYVLAANNQILALDKQTGAVLFKSKRPDLLAFGTNTKDNIIYAATRQGEILAIKPVFVPGESGDLVLNTRSLNGLALAFNSGFIAR